MENRDLNQRVLKRLEEKIAIEEFRKENNIQKKKKSNIFLKVASFIIIIGIVVGNIYTYATYKQDMITYVLDKLSIFKNNRESLILVNETRKYNEITLTLENYAIENNTLMIGYRLKLDKEKELLVDDTFDITTLIVDEERYHLNKSTISPLYKVNDTEYEIFKLYNLGDIEINDSAILETKITLPKYLDSNENIGEWEFKISIDKNNVITDYEEYVVKDVNGILESINQQNKYEHKFRIAEVEKSDMFTKIVIVLESYWTGNEKYFVEILDENGRIILEDNIQKLSGGIPTEIILRKLDFDSKININVYEKENLDSENKITAKGSVVLDFAKDLKPKEENEVLYTTKKWRNLQFTYDKEIEVYETIRENIYTGEDHYIHFKLYEFIGEKKDTSRMGVIQIECDENSLNKSLEEIFNEQIAINNVENTDINGVDAISWFEENTDKKYMFIYKNYIYKMTVPNNAKTINIIKDFIENIEFL